MDLAERPAQGAGEPLVIQNIGYGARETMSFSGDELAGIGSRVTCQRPVPCAALPTLVWPEKVTVTSVPGASPPGIEMPSLD